MKKSFALKPAVLWPLLWQLFACQGTVQVPGPSSPLPPPQPGKVGLEAITLLQHYLRLDTTNPPGNELKAARFLQAVLQREGIRSELAPLGGNRANLWAVLRGDGTRRGIILLHHMDVVAADARHWRVPPFSGKMVKGEIYGRGAIDIKGKGIVDLLTLIQLKRQRASLKRDVIFLAVADEEVGSRGTRWLLTHRRELLRSAEFLLDEGTSVISDRSRQKVYYPVAIGEKAPLWLTVTFHGAAGHASTPGENSPVHRAIRAAQRIVGYQPEPRLLPELGPWLKMMLADRRLEGYPGFSGSLEKALENQEFLRALAKEADLQALLRDTIAITQLRGSDQINVIPNQASFSLDCRLLPDKNKEQFLAELRTLMADDKAELKVIDYVPASLSSSDTAFFKALRRVAARRDSGSLVFPTILQSSTDASFYRSLGIAAYGFESYRITQEEADRSHGNDERIPAASLGDAVERLTELIKELSQ
jgi:acetylornithine deacetylase/succinyl-diaminopimelate desuccinylase-like protein